MNGWFAGGEGRKIPHGPKCHETRQLLSVPTIPPTSNIISAMADQARSEIFKDNPIGKGLDAFRSSFKLVCENQTIPSTPDSLRKLGHDGKQPGSIDVHY